MKVLIINTSQSIGGAAIAANRLMKALDSNGIDAKMLVRDKQSEQNNVIGLRKTWKNTFYFLWERIVIWKANRFRKKNLFTVDIANIGIDITSLPQFIQADIIHLHWVNQGMLSLKGIQKIINSGKPIVWTMHDMWPCTGICHHAGECDKYTSQCRYCPQLYRGGNNEDLSYQVFNKKKELYHQSPITFTVCSNWLKEKAMRSALLNGKEIYMIPNTLSTETFIIHDKVTCRKKLGLPIDKHIIVFGAARIDDPIKGFDYLLRAIRHLLETKTITEEELHLVCFGRIKQEQEILNSIPISYTYLGTIEANILPVLYSAGDIVISSSLYETFGQTIIEAQACGCIPVSFNNSGQTDIITHKKNGYLAKYLSIQDLACGIHWAMTEADIDNEELRKSVVDRYSEDIIANQYIKLYNKILKTEK